MSVTAHEKPEPPDKCPQVEIVRESDKEQHAQAMGDAELCEFITKALSPAKKILTDSLAYIAEARKRFAQPGRRVPVPGKPTWGNWIKQNLGISDRHVRRLLAGKGEPQKRQNKKPGPRVEVESAGIILGNRGLEMARKLRDGDVDGAKRIAAEMLEVDLDCPDGLLPPPVPEHMKTLGKGDIETLASLWRQAFDPLTHAQRRDMLVQFLGLIPGEHIADVTAAIERAPIHMGCASAAGKAEKRSGGDSRKPPASVKATECSPVRGSEEECGHGTLDAASVQGSAPVAEGRGSTPPKKTSQEYRRRKTLAQRKWREKQKQARLAAQAASPAPPQGAGHQGVADQDAPQPAAAPTTDVPAGEASTVSLVESRPVPGMGEAGQNRNAQPGEQQTPRRKPMETAAKPYRVKPRTKPGFKTDYLIVCDGDKQPYDVFDTESEAKAVCERLNAPPVAGIVPQEINPRSAAQPPAY